MNDPLEKASERLLSRKELAVRWGVSIRTVKSWTDGHIQRCEISPRLIRYRLSGVKAYEASKTFPGKLIPIGESRARAVEALPPRQRRARSTR
jgi:hypothetical protein